MNSFMLLFKRSRDVPIQRVPAKKRPFTDIYILRSLFVCRVSSKTGQVQDPKAVIFFHSLQGGRQKC